jgi:hypothetical protein
MVIGFALTGWHLRHDALKGGSRKHERISLLERPPGRRHGIGSGRRAARRKAIDGLCGVMSEAQTDPI